MTNVAEAPSGVDAGKLSVLPELYRFSAASYDRLARMGLFASGDKLELLSGLLVRKMPSHPLHGSTITRLMYLLVTRCGGRWVVRPQLQIALTADSMPEPDLAVVRGTHAELDANHPTPSQTALVVEVSDSSLRIDLGVKLALYAAAKIPEYWVVDLAARRLHVRTLPRGGKKPGYRRTIVLEADAEVPLTLRGEAFGSIRVTEFLP